MGLGLIGSLAFLPIFLGSVRPHFFAACLLPVIAGLTLWFWGPSTPGFDDVRLRACSLRWWILAAAGAFLVSAAFSKVPFKLPAEALKVAGGWIIFEAALHFGQSRERRYFLCQFALFYGAAISVYGILQFLGAFPKTWWHQQQFLSATYVNHNHFAGLLEVILPIGLGFAIAERQVPKKILYLFATAVTMLAFVLTLSRGGYLALALAIIVMFAWLTFRREQVPAILVLLGVAFFLVGSLMVFGTEPLAERIKTFQAMDGMEELSILYRWWTWRGALDVFRTHPLFGGGPGAFEYLFLRVRPEPFPGRPIFAHNDWLQLLADGGLILTAATAALFGAFFYKAKPILDRDDSRFRACVGAGAAASVVALCVHGIFDFNFQIPANWAWFCFAAGLLQSFSERQPLLSAPPSRRTAAFGLAAGAAWLAVIGGVFYVYCAEASARQADIDFEKKSPQAASAVAHALRLLPQNPEMHYLNARLQAAKSRQGALSEVEQAIRLNPYEPVFERFRARLLASPGPGSLSGEQLAKVFYRALEKDPKNARIHLLVAQDLLEVGGARGSPRSYLKFAMPILEQAVDMQPALSEQAADLLKRFGVPVRDIEAFMYARPVEALQGYLWFLNRNRLWGFYRKPFLRFEKIRASGPAGLQSETAPFRKLTLYDFQQAKEGDPIRRGEWWYLGGQLNKEISVENGCRRVVIKAKGTFAEGGYPFLILRYGGRVVDAFYVDSKVYKNYDAWIPMSAETRILSLEFYNDWADRTKKEDRNLWIKQLEFYRPVSEGAC